MPFKGNLALVPEQQLEVGAFSLFSELRSQQQQHEHRAPLPANLT